MQKILLYYIFTPITDPEAIRLWQRTLCESLGLRGRILISDKGLNGTVGGDLRALKTYARETKTYPAFKTMTFKWSEGAADDFPKLTVKIRSETVTLGWEPEVSKDGVVGGGKHLKPQQVHDFVAQHPNAVFFDGRNHYESDIGRFKNAVTPDIKAFKEMPAELDKSKYADLKDKPIITYCTGGIRCETLSALMKTKGFSDVYQIDGGIAHYGETFGDAGLWEGKLYIFDKRKQLSFSESSTDIAVCGHCGEATSNQINCSETSCNKQITVCNTCANRYSGCKSHKLVVLTDLT